MLVLGCGIPRRPDSLCNSTLQCNTLYLLLTEQEYINHRHGRGRGVGWGGDVSCLHAANPTKGAKQRREETRKQGRGVRVREERNRSLCSFLRTKFMSLLLLPPQRRRRRRRLFLPSAKGLPLPLPFLPSCQKTKMLFRFSQVEKSRK